MQYNRIVYFDLLKLFAIFLVIWGHCIQFFRQSYECNDSVYLIIYSFHMPLFMIISGYFSSYKSYRLSTLELIKKKFRELLLPVITWGIIFEIIHVTISLYKGNCFFPLYDLKAFYFENLWFLKCLFICYISAYCCFKHNKTNYYYLGATIIISQFLTTHNICTMYPAFLAGIFLQRHNSIIDNRYYFIISWTIYFILLYFWNSSFWPIPNMLYSVYSGDFSIIYNYIVKGGVRIVIGITGSYVCIYIFKNLLLRFQHKTLNFISNYGKYTLGIYILQSFIIEYTLSQYVNFDQYSVYVFDLIIAPTISLVTLSLLIIIVKLSYKTKIASFLLWGKSLLHD